MTPKEKAEELVIKFQFKPEGIYKDLDKRCALIAVDEILNVACDESDYDKSVTKIYWQEVKQEIEAL